LTVGSENATWPSVSRHGGRLAFARTVRDIGIWQVARPGAGVPAEMAGPSKVIYANMFNVCPAYSPDGRQIAFSSNRSGTHEIWLSNSDGTNQRQLTRLDSGGALRPQWSPDGRTIAFWAEQQGRHRVSLIDAEGGKERRLTTDRFDEFYPSWSRDGNWIYFYSNRGEGGRLWKKAVQEGTPLQVTPRGGIPAFESSDQRSVYYGDAEGRIWKVPISGGEETLVLTHGRGASWALSESGLCVLEPYAKGGPAIEFYSLVGGKLTERLTLPGEPDSYIWNSAGTISISPDRRWLLYEHCDRLESDIILADNFR
jgi:Tol biopolymer transport system component